MSKHNNGVKFREPHSFADALIQAAMDAQRPPIFGVYIRRSHENKVIAYTTAKPALLVWNAAKAMQDGRDRRTDWVLFVRRTTITEPIRDALAKSELGFDTSENAIYQMVLCVPGVGWSVATVPATEFTTEEGELRASYPDNGLLMVDSLLVKVDTKIIVEAGDIDFFRIDLAELKEAIAYYGTIPQRETRQEYIDILQVSVVADSAEIAALDTVVDALMDRTAEHRLFLDAETPAHFIESLLEAIPDAYGYSDEDRTEAIEGAIDAEIEEEGAREDMLAEFEDGIVFKNHVLLINRLSAVMAVRAMGDKGVHPRRVALLTATALSNDSTIETSLITMFDLPEDDDAQVVALRLAMGGAAQELGSNVAEHSDNIAVAVTTLSTINGRVRLTQPCGGNTGYTDGDVFNTLRKGGAGSDDAHDRLAHALSHGHAERLLLDMTTGKDLLAQAQFAYEGRWSQSMANDRRHKVAAPKSLSKLMREAAKEAILAGWTIPMVAATAHVETDQ